MWVFTANSPPVLLSWENPVELEGKGGRAPREGEAPTEPLFAKHAIIPPLGCCGKTGAMPTLTAR